MMAILIVYRFIDNGRYARARSAADKRALQTAAENRSQGRSPAPPMRAAFPGPIPPWSS